MTDKITIKELEKFSVGDCKVYVLPSWKKARSAQSFCNQQKNYSGKKFKAFISPAVEGTESRTVTITRLS